MAKIFDILDDVRVLIDTIEENEGDVTEEILDKLAVNENDFKDKIRYYTDAVKELAGDIATIGVEENRLHDLKVRKQKTMDRLEKFIMFIIEKYGEATKSGSLFVDYGTGKVAIRTSKKCEVDDELVDTAIKRFISNLNFNMQMNEAQYAEEVDINSFLFSGNIDDEDDGKIVLTESDRDNINLKASISIPLSLISKGDKLRWLCNTLNSLGAGEVVFDSRVNKAQLKKDIENNGTSSVGKIVSNKTLNIK